MANQQTIIGLDTPGCSWDPLFSAYYAQHRQEILPGEVDFWRSHCRPGDRVLEVGAGTGFIARAYAPLPRLELTLIEPEATNVAYLKRISTNPTTTLEIFPGIFQHFKQPQPFDLVVSSWDNLVMFTDDKGKDGFFSFAARSLRPGGRFVTHLSSEKWNKQVFLKLQKPKEFAVKIDDEEFQVTFLIEEAEKNLYHKMIVLRSLSRNLKKNYALPTRIDSLERTLERASAAGFVLLKRTSDISGTTHPIPMIMSLSFKSPNNQPPSPIRKYEHEQSGT